MNASQDCDEVVLETDVFLSKTLAENLFLFHYPTNNPLHTAERTEYLSGKIKPKQSKIELEFGLDTRSQNYDKSRGEQMAINVDGLNPVGETHFKSSCMDKFVLTSTNSRTNNGFYALGLIQQGELHLTPFHSFVEMRPIFNFMDKMDSLIKKTPDEEEEEEEAVAVTVRFEGPNAEKDRQLNEKSYQSLQQKNATEPWLNIKYHPCGSARSDQECQNLACSYMCRDVTKTELSTKDYLKALVPENIRVSTDRTAEHEEVISLTDQPLSDQLKQLMVNAHVLKFSTILENLSEDVDVVSVERLIQQIAVLVQGCWVVKSELLYSEDSVSLRTGYSGKNLINARDYIVWLYTKSRSITRHEVLTAVFVPDSDLHNIISEIAVRADQAWEFKFPYDSEFVENHRSIEQSQDIKWNLRYKKLVKDLNLGMNDSQNLTPLQKLPCPVLPRPKQKRHSRSSMSEEGEESGTDSCTSGIRDSKAKRVCSPKKRNNSGSKPAKSKPYHIATLDVSPTFLETTPSDEVKAELKDCVEDAIRERYIMTQTELKEVVSDSSMSALVSRSDFESLLEEALLNCGAQKLKNKWPQNTTPEPLYAYTSFGNKSDRYRNILLELFTTTARARTNFFVKTVEDELREIISENDCRQIFEDYCVHKSGFYYLKGTISQES